MNPSVENLRKLLAAKQCLPAATGVVAARPQTPKPVLKLEPTIPPAPQAGALDDWFPISPDPADEAMAGPKPIGTPRRDDRKSCRNVVPQARQSCELKTASNVLPALLVNESQGGFAVLIDGLDGIKIGKKVELHTDMGWFTVRVIYASKVASPNNVAPKGDAWYRLGIKKT